MHMRWIERINGKRIVPVLVLAAWATWTSAAAAPPAGPPSPASTAAVDQVDINTANASDLVDVPGIGPATAERIVAWREQNGAFRSVEDLMKVRGIAEKSMEKLRPYVKVGKGK